MTSIIIPSRSPEYLQKTVDDLIKNARGDFEIIIVFDGIWPQESIKDHPKIRMIHHGSQHNSLGMRESINKGVALARGDFIMKTDEHCMFDEGFDVKLTADCKDNWVVIPRRFRLDPDNWKLIEDGRPPIDYMYIAYPYERPNDKTCGLHGSEWKDRAKKRKDILMDDTMSWQGSCWFMNRKHWDNTIKEMDTENYGSFTQEAQEIGNKTWLSGGRLVVNKKTWYAHMHKGNKGKRYGFSNRQYDKHMEGTERGRLYCIDYWLNNRWPEAKYDWEWLMNKFWPVPTWPENWKEQLKIDEPMAYKGVEINQSKV